MWYAGTLAIGVSPFISAELQVCLWKRPGNQAKCLAGIRSVRQAGHLPNWVAPFGAPETLKKSPAPLFHAASRKVLQEFYEAYKYFVAAFQDAAARLRAGESDVLFPAGSFPPASPWVSG